MTMQCTLSTAMLAFARSVQLSEALLWGRVAQPAASEKTERSEKPEERLVPIEVVEKGFRGQNLDEKSVNPGDSHVGVVDSAVIPSGCDSLVINFNVRILPNAMRPHSSDKSEVADAYAALAKDYANNGGFVYLAERYVWNVLNGRFAWRNRFQSDEAQVKVEFGDTTITSNALMLDLDRFPGREVLAQAVHSEKLTDLDDLINGIAGALADGAFEFSVSWTSKMPAGSEVWPSQEYLRSEVKDSKEFKGRSRVYATLPAFLGERTIRQASIHSQKIGAALRHIDDWHKSDSKYGAIAVNPFGGVQGTGAVLRGGRDAVSASFYKVMDEVDKLFKDVTKPASDMASDTHFFFANLVRGGAFTRSDEGKKGKKKGAKA